jgi:predicted adenylyl cyclase CyaB
MQNIEIKARCADPDAVRRRLTRLGIPLARRMRQVDTYFLVPHGRLKLREIDGGEAQLIQYHRPDATDPRASDYVIAPVQDPAALTEALARALGVRAVVDKQRELYLWRHTRIHLDEVAGLGSFLELETVVTDQTQGEAEQECQEVQAALEIQGEDLIGSSYVDLPEGEVVSSAGRIAPS